MGDMGDLKKLYYQGKYQEVLNITNIELENKNLPVEKSINLLNYQSSVHLKLGDFQNALEMSDQSINLSTQINNEYLAFNSIKSKIDILLRTHNLKELDKSIIQMKNLTINFKNSDQINYATATLLYLNGAVERSKGNFSIAKKQYLESLEISSNFTDVELSAMTLNHLGINSEYLGENEVAIDYYEKALHLFQKINYKSFIAGVSSNLGLIHRQMGKLDQALTNFNQSSIIAQSLQDNTLIAGININLGLTNIDLGNLKKAQNYLETAIEIFKSINLERGLILAYLNLGIIYNLRTEFNQAIQLYQDAAELAEKIDDKVNLSRVRHNIAQTYRAKGEYKLALLNFKKVLEIHLQLENSYVMGQIYYELVITTTLSNEQEDAKLYLDGFKILVDSNTDEKLDTLFKLANATYLKSSVEVDVQLEAKRILREIINTENVQYETLMETIPKLCEILVKEYNWTKSENVIIEINTLLEKLSKLSSESPSYSVKVEVAILKSKTALILEDPTSSINELRWAEDLAAKYDLEYLIKRVANEKLELERHILSMKQVTEQAAVMLDLNKMFTDEYLDYINKEFRPFSADI